MKTLFLIGLSLLVSIHCNAQTSVSKHYSGTVTSIDLGADSFTITNKSGKTKTIHLKSTTKIKKGTEPSSIDAIQVDEQVSGRDRIAGTGAKIASSLIIKDRDPFPSKKTHSKAQ